MYARSATARAAGEPSARNRRANRFDLRARRRNPLLRLDAAEFCLEATVPSRADLVDERHAGPQLQRHPPARG